MSLTVGLVMADAAAGFTGSVVPPDDTSCFCTSGESMNCRNFAHASVASVVHEKPSPPPSAACGSPAPPSVVGNANHPSLESSCLSSVRSDITYGFHVPCSSIAALPLATMPAELPAPCWAVVPSKSFWNGLVSRNFCMSSPALMKHGSDRSWLCIACFMVSVEHSRSAKYSHQNAAGQRSLAPIAIGAMPASLSFWTSALRSSSVLGGSVMPAFSNRSLRYQKPTTCWLYGAPYCLPSVCQPWAIG